MTRDELEIRQGRGRRDTRAFIIRRRVIERAGERLTLGIAQRGIIEPQDLKQRSLNGQDRRLVIRSSHQ